MERGSPSLDCPKNGKRLVVPFLFEWETLKLVTPDVCELVHVGQHVDVLIFRNGRVPSSGRFPHCILKSLVGYICSFP